MPHSIVGRLPIALLLLVGCIAVAAPAAAASAIQVAVSVPPQAYLVDRIGGNRVEVQVMIPPGTSPTTYEPSPHQMVSLHHALLYLKVGHPDFPFESRHLASILRRYPQLEVLDMYAVDSAAESGLTASELTRTFTPGDPHLWMAPGYAEAAAFRLTEVLTELDPSGAPLYEANLRIFLGELWNLDRSIRGALAGLKQRRFLVQHPAWGYFANQYDLEQVAIEEEGKEPSPGQIVDLIERAREEDIHVIFVQTGISDRSARVIAREIGAQLVELDPLAYDWLDNLSRTADAFWSALNVD